MLKSFKYRLYPNKAQTFALYGQLEAARQLYNAALMERREAWRTCRKSINYFDQANQLKTMRADGLVDLANYSACQFVLRKMHQTFQAFFRRVKRGDVAGFPRFKSKKRYASFTYPSYGDGCKLVDGILRLQGIGEVKVKLHRAVTGKIKTVGIKREGDKWFAIFTCEVGVTALPACSAAVGIDAGIKEFAVTSDGEFISNPKFFEVSARKLRRYQRMMARRKKFGTGWRRAAKLVAATHRRIGNQRRDFHHKVSRFLVNENGLIAVEDLNVKGLAGGMLAKQVYDVGWASFFNMLAYKAEEAGRVFVKVNPSGTTQNCSSCGIKVPKGLSVRVHDCACGLKIDRDLNAALNILGLGLSLVTPTQPVTARVVTEAVCFS